ncbi:MAG: VWA domain-containing protein, partial [Planctomycetes bacterium]|nr:VWA domain-containing protein [Planctomycetota bacterium]
MKNENVPDIEQGLHERLCAYVFGELQGSERAAFEAELLRSPALQRERERLTATIGLVKSAVPDVGLSTSVRRDIVASAKRSRFRFLSGRSIARLAAAVVLLGGGLLAVRFFANGDGPYTYGILDGDKTARLESLEKKERRVDLPASVPVRDDAAEAMRSLGYVGGSSGPADGIAAVAPAEKKQELPQIEGFDDKRGQLLDRFHPDPEALRDLPSGATGGTPLAAQPEADSSMSLFMATTEVPQISEALEERESVPADYGTLPSAFASRLAGNGGRASGSGGAAGPATPGAGAPAAPLSVAYARSKQPMPPAREALQGAAATAQRQLDAVGYGGGDEDELQAMGLDESRRDELTDAVELSYQKKLSVAQLLGRKPALTREQVAAQIEQLLDSTRLAPGESPRDMFFRYWGDSPFLQTEEQKLSTFAVDVDTASYALARAYLNRGELPPRAAVRTEEFVNYFKADQAAPTDGKPFAIGMELAPSLFAKDTRAEMLRVTVRAKDVADFERKPVALTFVIDHSGSMAEGGRLELVKRSLMLLLRQLYGTDSVAIVTFSNDATLVTSAIPAARRGELEALIKSIGIEGGTNVEAGLRLGYAQALQNLARNAVNRVILCSDGVGNIGDTTSKGILTQIDEARKSGIYLNTVG